MLRIDLLEQDGLRALRGVPVQKLADKTVLVTGASGIIGTHFLYGLKHCRQELGLRLNVVGVVQRDVPEHLQLLEQQGVVKFLRGDLADARFLESMPAADVVIHAATYGQPALFTANPEVTLKLNTTALFDMLDKLRPDGKCLFVSTSEVYSGLNHPPFNEMQIGTTNTTHPRACYIEAKRCGEAICNAYRGKALAVKSARLSLAYGPGTRLGDNRVLNSFIEHGLRQGVIRLMDPGVAKRTYCYVADAVHMMWRILLEGKEPIYNVGGTSRTTIAELATLIGNLLNVPVEIPAGSAGALAGAPEDVSLDLTRFSTEFGPLEFTPLEEGVARTMEWYKAMVR